MKIGKGKILFLTFGTTLILSPYIVSARPLTIENATKDSITVRINNTCSNEFGIMKTHTSKTISEAIQNKLCEKNIFNCVASIYKSNDCSGDEISNFLFDTRNGLVGAFFSSPNYSLTVSYLFNAVSVVETL